MEIIQMFKMNFQIYGLSSKLAPSIKHEFIIPKELENSLDIDANFGPPQTNYIWHLKGWTECTKTCGKGKFSFGLYKILNMF